MITKMYTLYGQRLVLRCIKAWDPTFYHHVEHTLYQYFSANIRKSVTAMNVQLNIMNVGTLFYLLA